MKNNNLIQWSKIITPEELKKIFPLNKSDKNYIKENHKIIQNIIHWKDDKLIVIVWPCSIHNIEEWLEYAKKLADMRYNFPNLFIIMRTYFEKPRTTIWWKWLINDPYLDWNSNIEEGLKKARKFITDINKLKLPAATEFLDNMTIPDISDWISWWAIWARTTESQLHREMASGLSMPIWFKNSTNGDMQIAFEAIISSNNKHSFIWIDENWTRKNFNTQWNPDGHIILRGGKWIHNYDRDSVNTTIKLLEKFKIKSWIIIDFSHANSDKKWENQIKVCTNVSEQLSSWNKKIIWVMIESNINQWSQSFIPWLNNKDNLQKWVSITDECVWLADTQKMLTQLNKAVEKRNFKN